MIRGTANAACQADEEVIVFEVGHQGGGEGPSAGPRL